MKKIILLILISVSVNSQVTQEWVQRYNRIGNSDDRANSVAADALGNIYVAGFSQNNIGEYGCCVIKYNPTGVQQWVQHYNAPGSGSDYLYDIALDNMSNIYVTGYTLVQSISRTDCLTLKYNSAGVLKWFARYDGPNLNDEGRSIAVDNSGNVYVTGRSDTITADQSSFITIKYDSSGVQQWAVRYPGLAGGFNSAVSIAVDNAASVYITGYNAITPNNLDYVTIKYNTSGTQLWAARYNGTGNSFDIPKCMVLDTAGNVYVTGESAGNPSADCLTIKYSTGGAQVWVARYNGTGNNNDGGNSMALDNSGGLIVTGRSIVSGPEDILIIKYSQDGFQQWVNTYSGPGNGLDAGNYVVTDNSGSSYVTGFSKTVSSENDIITLKYSSGGILQWTMSYNGGFNENDYGNSITLDASNNVIVTGHSAASVTTFDIATIKYSQLVGVIPVSSEIPLAFYLNQNYPNPFNPSTNVGFDIPQNSRVKISVYDILGNEIEQLVNEKLVAGSYNIEFNAADLPSGVYFYVLESGINRIARKMIITK
jgi:uncharacterized delta-60 repeat protein